VEYQYCPNPNSEVPVMLINKHIGINAKGEEGIMSDQFQRELLSLKNQGKTNVDVWVNTAGGNIYQGWGMYGAMKDCGMNVTTKNIGLASSVGSWLMQAGNKRVWNSYALSEMHNAGNVSADSDTNPINEGIALMLTSKTGKTTDEVRAMMNDSRIITAQEALSMGLCDEVTNLGESSLNIVEATNHAENLIVKTFVKSSNMSKVNELLGLTNEASEVATFEAVSKLVTAKNEAEQKLTATETLLSTTTVKLTEVTNEVENLKKAEKQTKAEALIAELKGKSLPSVASLLVSWTNLAVNDYDSAKAMIEGLALNATAVTLETATNNANVAYVPTTAQEFRDSLNKK